MCTCESLSVAMTKYLRIRILRRKVLVCFIMSKESVHDLFFLHVVSKQNMIAERALWSRAVNLMAAEKQRETERGKGEEEGERQ